MDREQIVILLLRAALVRFQVRPPFKGSGCRTSPALQTLGYGVRFPDYLPNTKIRVD